MKATLMQATAMGIARTGRVAAHRSCYKVLRCSRQINITPGVKLNSCFQPTLQVGCPQTQLMFGFKIARPVAAIGCTVRRKALAEDTRQAAVVSNVQTANARDGRVVFIHATVTAPSVQPKMLRNWLGGVQGPLLEPVQKVGQESAESV